MKRFCLYLALITAFTMLLTFNAFALNNVWVEFSGDPAGNIVYIGETNIVEYWLANDANLSGAISLGFEFSWVPSLTVTFDIPYGAYPAPAAPNFFLAEHGDAIGVWNLGGLQVSPLTLLGTSPETVLIGGAALAAVGLPADAAGRMCYSMSMQVAGAVDELGGLCVDNVFVPPGGGWIYNNGTGGYPPDFFGATNTSTGTPDAPAVCFDVVIRPCVPPVFTSTPAAVVANNHCLDYDFQFAATEGGNNPPADPVVFGGDAAANGAFHVAAPLACGSDQYNVTATNACMSVANFGFQIDWTNNAPAVTCPADGIIAKGNPWFGSASVVDADPCDGGTYGIAVVGPAPVGGFVIDGVGNITFNTDDLDGGNTYTFEVTFTDDCGDADACQFDVEVLATEPFLIHIEKTHNTLQGHYEYVSITKELGSELMGGFDFLIGYDASALSFASAKLGALLDPAGCGWEYFTYRYGAFGNCGGPCPSGKLRVVAIADQNNGPNHPACYGGNGELVELKFYVTNDRTFECMYVPVFFCWLDCGDNGISSTSGDTLFISKEVYDFEWDGNLANDNYKITGIDCGNGSAFKRGGACPECDVSDKTEPVRFVYFWNGGVDIVCADSIDDPGDLNLNGIKNEIADAVLYTNYFLFGISVFDIALEAQIAASEINNDGVPLTVGDLVYLIRIITGDALPYAKLAPFAGGVNVNITNGIVSTDASAEIGGVYAVFAVNGSYDVVNNTDMELLSNEAEGQLKVLVYSGTENLSNRIAAGNNDLFTVAGNVELVDIQVADYNGNMLDTRVNKVSLPENFELLQNTPNPFNPTTKITLELPVVSSWTIDIYNVAGQLVESFNGNDIGTVTVDWNASSVASGIYFYKAQAGDFTATKKMVLMK